MDQQSLVEHRYRAVREVLAGSPPGEVALRYGVSRQSLHAWRRRFEAGGRAGLADRSRRPVNSPTRTTAAAEALICQMRRDHPRWGARRIAYELSAAGVVDPAPARATVHRVLARNGLIAAQDQQHQRKYRRWQREAPMQLWQMDLVGGVPLADGRECKMVTGIDDHSRFVVIATVVPVQSGRAVCSAFAAAMNRYGVPFEVLTDNGKQFTGRHTRPQPVEVMFERMCREHGIAQRLTKPRSPTTTGKIERWHKTLRRELLDHVQPFESLQAAQEAIDSWVYSYNHHRPHQSLAMATPASLFRSHGPTRDSDVQAPALVQPHPASALEPHTPEAFSQGLDTGTTAAITVPEQAESLDGHAIEFEIRVPPSGEIHLRPSRQTISLGKAMAGRVMTIWADQRSIHLVLEGQIIKTVFSRLVPSDLRFMSMRGARPAGPSPAAPAFARANGQIVLPTGTAVEVDKVVHRDGHVILAGHKVQVGFALAGGSVTMRLDGHLMHAIADGALIGTWPCLIPTTKAAALKGARASTTTLPPPPLPAGSLRAQRRVHENGRIMVNRQRLKLGTRHAGKLVTVIIEDTHYRVLHNGEEIAIKPRRDTTPITRLHVRGKGAEPQ